MPTPYTGDPLGVEPPSGAPEPEAGPIVNLPADADPPNASTWIQGYKALADWIAFALKPRAKASDWTKAITRWRSAAGHQRFGIDHQGFPMGGLNHFRELFRDSMDCTSPTGVADITTNVYGNGWMGIVNRAATGTEVGRVITADPDATWPFSRYLTLAAPDDWGSYAAFAHSPLCKFQTDTVIVMEWWAKIRIDAGLEVTMGFDSTLGVSAHGSIALFRYNSLLSGGNWRCETDDGTTTGVTATAVAADVNWHKFRIEYHAANVDDAGTERMLFFIDYALVGNRTANMPSTGTKLVRPFWKNLNYGGAPAGSWAMSLAPVTYCNNIIQDAF